MLVIGFAAWLANLGGSGGGAGNFNYPDNRREDAQKLNETIGQIPQPVLVLGISLLILFLLALIVLYAWLRARARFMFIDCIVKNRGAIAEPWREFRKEGNGYFLFWLLIAFVVLIFAALLSLPLIILAIKGNSYYLHRDRLGLFAILAIAAWVFALLLVIVAWALIASFIVPVMYHRRSRPYQAVRAAVSLIATHPGEIVLYCLFLVVLLIATGLISCFAICATCCIAVIPYIGAVILLPVFVLVQAFSLSFLCQFGADYDVWAGSMPPGFLPILSDAPPAPPEPPSPPVG